MRGSVRGEPGDRLSYRDERLFGGNENKGNMMNAEHVNQQTFDRKTAPEGQNIKPNAIMTMIFFVLLVVGIGGTIGAIRKFFEIRKMEHSGASAQGTIINLRTWDKDAETTYYYLQYQFEALTQKGNRQTITSPEKRVSGRLYKRLAVGDTVTILYSPQAPDRSFMKEGKGDFYGAALMILLVLVMGILGVWMQFLALDIVRDIQRDGKSTSGRIIEKWKEGDSEKYLYYIACQFETTLLTGEKKQIIGKQKVSARDYDTYQVGETINVLYLPYTPKDKPLIFRLDPTLSNPTPSLWYDRVTTGFSFFVINLCLRPLLTLVRLGRASVKFIVGPIMAHTFLKRSANLPIESCEPRQLPAENQELFLHIFNELEPEGFDLMSYYVLQVEPQKDISIKAYSALLRHRNQQDIAEIGWIPKPLVMIGFSSEVNTKKGRMTIQTTNNSYIESCPIPHKHIYRFPRIQFLHRLYLLHRAFIWEYAEEGEDIVQQERTEIQRRIKTAMKEEFDAQVKANYLYLDASGTCYRPTWKGACLLTWKQMWPIQDILRLLLKRREKTLLTHILTGQLALPSPEKFPKKTSVRPLLRPTPDGYWIGEYALTDALRKLPHAEMIHPLIEALGEPDRIVREVAVGIFAGTGLPVIEFLVQIMLADQNIALQKKATRILQSIASIDTIILGQRELNADPQPPVTFSPHARKRRGVFFKKAQIMLDNPDISQCATAIPGLHTIHMYPASCDMYQVERFLTYSVNYLGERYLNRYVEVEIYGDPATIHPNIRNTLTNLCKRVQVHQTQGDYHVNHQEDERHNRR